jgi:Tfp pilus assembly protein PilE
VGQQQLLLVVLGTIIVGIAVVVGIQMFTDSSTSTNIDMTTAELVDHAWSAQAYYRRSRALGGGGKTFTGWVLTSDSSDNATYTATVSEQVATITGTCLTAKTAAGNPVTVVVTVLPKSLSTQINQ